MKAAKKKKKPSPLNGMRITKPLAWLEKYLLRARRRMPAMSLPKRILSFKPRLTTRHRTWGSCCITDRTITLSTHKVSTVEKKIKNRRGEERIKREKVVVPLNHREILMTLAHELAHLEYPEHGYEQKWYALTIFNTFGLYDICPHCNGKGKIPARYENE
jgi:hypothetical protein